MSCLASSIIDIQGEKGQGQDGTEREDCHLRDEQSRRVAARSNATGKNMEYYAKPYSEAVLLCRIPRDMLSGMLKLSWQTM